MSLIEVKGSSVEFDDEYSIDKSAYRQGRAASAVGAPASTNPYSGRTGEMWMMGWSYDNHIGNI